MMDNQSSLCDLTQGEGSSLRTLIIDNYDSYTFNLFQLVAKVNGVAPYVIRNNQVTSEEILEIVKSFDNVIISPGPGIPTNEKDFGICISLLSAKVEIPIFGVCLGHQGLAHHYGAKVIHAPRVAHGVVSQLEHDTTSELFRGIPRNFHAVRYHSWIVDSENFPDHLEPLAWTNDESRIIMAMRHKEKPHWGVQFHPESICTEYGEEMFINFREMTVQYNKDKQRKIRPIPSLLHTVIPASRDESTDPEIPLRYVKLPLNFPHKDPHFTETVFRKLHESSTSSFFWLDSSRVEKNLSRFSILGFADSIDSYTLQYNATTRTIIKKTSTQSENIPLHPYESFFDYMEDEITKRKCHSVADLPFDFRCGYVGYFGYEMGYECLMPDPRKISEIPARRTPDSAFIFSDRAIVFDHQEGDVYLLCLSSNSSEKWIKDMENTILRVETSNLPHPNNRSNVPLEFTLNRDHSTYISDINNCLSEIHEGESYELCLTNQVSTETEIDPISLFYYLRKSNPAPYAALLHFVDDFSVVSCSPERFLTIDSKGLIESKPIKGTAPRGKTKEEDEAIKQKLKNSQKDFAENLMIVDLIRNDIGKVCDIGSVNVPKLMNVESYSTVHQLVTTVRGQLRSDLHAIDCIKQAFPPGSMTGAPKLRSVQILERLEKSPRGVYSGCLGYMSLNGACDLSVVIRTAIIDKKGLYIGCGGAIVADSDTEEEFNEILLKANALLKGITAVHVGSSLPSDFKMKVKGVESEVKEAVSNNEQSIENTPNFQLFETILFEQESRNFYLLDYHLNRIQNSSQKLGFNFNRSKLLHELEECSKKWESDTRVRLVLYRDGRVEVTGVPFQQQPDKTFRVALANSPIDINNKSLYHKTTERQVYNDAYSSKPEGTDDVILWNNKGEITESTIANVAILKEEGDANQWVTPPISCGLLGGTMRAHLLEQENLIEEIVTIEQFKEAKQIKLFNSLRKEIKATFQQE